MIHFVVHDEQDSVGVVVVEGVKSGQQLTGWIMDQDKEIKVRKQFMVMFKVPAQDNAMDMLQVSVWRGAVRRASPASESNRPP